MDHGHRTRELLRDSRGPRVLLSFARWEADWLLRPLHARRGGAVHVDRIRKPDDARTKALERVGLGHRIDHPATKLSGGERQRRAARGLRQRSSSIRASVLRTVPPQRGASRPRLGPSTAKIKQRSWTLASRAAGSAAFRIRYLFSHHLHGLRPEKGLGVDASGALFDNGHTRPGT